MTTEEKTDRADQTGNVEKQGREKSFAPVAVLQAKEFLSGRLTDYNEKYFKKFAETGRAFGDNLRKDVSGIVEKAVESGKKVLSRVPFAESMERKAAEGIRKASSRLNIPRRDDVERLAKAVESLSQKVEALKGSGR